MTGDCDCCGNYSTTLRRVWYMGIETFACAKCRHDDDEEEQDNYAMNSYEIRKYTGVS